MIDVMDFEASSLAADSHPIEIGWTRGSETHSYLIRPYATWTDWDVYAEEHIHHISREQLMDEGIDPAEVLEIANASLGSDIVLCDGGTYDAHWLSVLQEGTGIEATFGLGSIQYMLTSHFNIEVKEFYKMKEQLTESGRLHRAGYDALLIKRAFLACLGIQFG